jgi:hypothetical protein
VTEQLDWETLDYEDPEDLSELALKRLAGPYLMDEKEAYIEKYGVCPQCFDALGDYSSYSGMTCSCGLSFQIGTKSSRDAIKIPFSVSIVPSILNQINTFLDARSDLD